MTSDQTWYIYATLVATSFLLVIIRAVIFISTILRSSDRLHDKLLEAILKGPADYFDKNSKDVILQCFSKDVASMDELLPGVFLDAMQGVLFNLSAVLLPSFLNPIIFLFAVPLVLLFLAYWSYYLKASRQIKLLEASSRVPVIKHFSEMLNGLVVIRNHEMQEEFTEEVFR
jgi:ATP-binding cassette subfamily C (CFTR/MRP) protein 4